MTFLSWITEATVETANGLFAQVLPDADTHDQITTFARQWGLRELLDGDLHTTVFYTRQSFRSVQLPAVNKGERWTAVSKRLTVWAGYDGEDYLILLLDSPGLEALHHRIRNTTGLVPTYPEYMPHMTLIHPVYERYGLEPKIAAANLALEIQPLKLEFRWGGINLL